MKDAILFHYVYLIITCFRVNDLKLILVNVNGKPFKIIYGFGFKHHLYFVASE